jgi:hypothetical protein
MNDRVRRVHEQIDRDRLRRHSNRVLHGHPSPTLTFHARGSRTNPRAFVALAVVLPHARLTWRRPANATPCFRRRPATAVGRGGFEHSYEGHEGWFRHPLSLVGQGRHSRHGRSNLLKTP